MCPRQWRVVGALIVYGNSGFGIRKKIQERLTKEDTLAHYFVIQTLRGERVELKDPPKLKRSSFAGGAL